MKYIINADDFGRTDTVTQAILYGFENGYLDRTTVMVNQPYFEQATVLAQKYGFRDRVGLHINLTQGEPLTEQMKACARFCGADGAFNGLIFQNRKMFFLLTKKEKKAIAAEIDAQIDKYFEYGYSLLHADSHGHVHTFLSTLPIVIKALKKRQFQSLRLSANLTDGFGKRLIKQLMNGRIHRFNRKYRNDCRYFDCLSKVKRAFPAINKEDGVCEVMLHPNIWDGEYKIGERFDYEDLQFILDTREGA